MRSIRVVCLLTLAMTAACTGSERSAGPVASTPPGLQTAPPSTPSIRSGGVTLAEPPPNALHWPYTGTTSIRFEGRATLDVLAYKAFAKALRLADDQVAAGGPIWAGVLPDGQRLAVVQTWMLGSAVTHTVAYVDRVGRPGRIVGDLTLAADTKAFTVVVPAQRPWRVTFRRVGAQIRPA